MKYRIRLIQGIRSEFLVRFHDDYIYSNWSIYYQNSASFNLKTARHIINMITKLRKTNPEINYDGELKIIT